MKVYAFTYCSCIYESAYGTVSLHKTKRGAYKAMRKDLLKAYEYVITKHPYHNCDKVPHSYRDHPLEYERWKVTTLDVEE